MLRRIRLAHLTMDTTVRKFARPIHIMETCGTHTASIFRNSIRLSIPKQLKILTGPGCSVCVVDPGYLKLLYQLVQETNFIIIARSDLINVPLNENRDKLSQFENVRTVFSVIEALDIARANPDKKIIYAAIGYQTCIPGNAVAMEIAIKERLDNFLFLPCYKKINKAMEHLLEKTDIPIDAFIICGHMSALTGLGTYQPIMDKNIPCLPTGIEPMQLIEGLAEICRQLSENTAQPNYDHCVGVTYDGNPIAKQYTEKYFTSYDAHWRGFGKIADSGYTLKPEFDDHNAFKVFNLSDSPVPDQSGCRCGEVISGRIEPPQCKFYKNDCTPENPNGPCMASTEGACRVWLKYSLKRKK